MGEVITLRSQDELAAIRTSLESQDEAVATLLPFPVQPDLSDALNDIEAPIAIDEEEYGGSLRVKRALGWLALQGQLTTPEGRNAYIAEYDDWRSALGEMLKSAEDLRLLVEVNREKVHQVKDGRVLASDNRTYMDNLVEAGAASSRNAAEAAVGNGDNLTARVMDMQARRDDSDVWNVHRVNDIVSGRIVQNGQRINRRTVVSMYPEESMNTDGDKPWNDLKYVRGLAYIQDYHFDGKQLNASTYSVSFADKEKLRTYLNGIGFAIPKDAHTSEWVRYGREDSIDLGVSSLPEQVRKGYYESIGKGGPRYSTETLMDSKEALMKQAFEDLNIPLSESIANGKKHTIIHQFAQQMLAHGNLFSAEVTRGLMRICSRNNFDDTDGRIIDELIRYSVAEDLRGHALNIAHTGKSEVKLNAVVLGSILPSPQAFIQQMGLKVAEGARAGHSYGGCPGKQLRVGRGEDVDSAEVGDYQEAFGGKDSNGDDEAQNIPANIRCLKCRQSSPKEKVVHKDFWCCPKCAYKVDVCTGEELHASNIESMREAAVPTVGATALDFKQKNRQEALPAAA
jgi:hypothetical protein